MSLKLRICIVGHHTSTPDEGVRRVASDLSRHLAERHSVKLMQIRHVYEWQQVRAWKPDILHFVIGGSSVQAFLAARLIAIFNPGSKVVISALQPTYGISPGWLRLFSPDVIIVQSSRARGYYHEIGWRVEQLPNGVDLERFLPVLKSKKRRLRYEYDLPREGFIVLHVGSLKRGRNVAVLKHLAVYGMIVVVVGRNSEEPDKEPLQELQEAGCRVLTRYLPRIEDLYALADCYVFPVVSSTNSIEMPLSVIEAMACNLPIVATPFGALPDYFRGVSGVTFVNGKQEMIEVTLRQRERKQEVATRTHIMDYSWDKVVERIEVIYKRLLTNGL